MDYIPAYHPHKNYNQHPHVVLLGAGASLAAFPSGDKYGRKLTLMNNLVDLVGLQPELKELGYEGSIDDFEGLFDYLNKTYPRNLHLEKIKSKIFG